MQIYDFTAQRSFLNFVSSLQDFVKPDVYLMRACPAAYVKNNLLTGSVWTCVRTCEKFGTCDFRLEIMMLAAGLRSDSLDGLIPNVGELGPPVGLGFVFGLSPRIVLESILRSGFLTGPPIQTSRASSLRNDSVFGEVLKTVLENRSQNPESRNPQGPQLQLKKSRVP